MNTTTIERAPPTMVEIKEGGTTLPVEAPPRDALLRIISSAARDSSVDVDKMQRLLDMHQQIELQTAKQAFDLALAEAQAEMRPVATDSANPQTKSRYASYLALDRAIRPIYTKHGFTVSFDTDPSWTRADDLMVLAYVSHSGYTRTYHMPMPADGRGAKGGEVMTRTHATGSAFTYGKRYLLCGIFNIAIGQDDDGNAAGRVFRKIQNPPRPSRPVADDGASPYQPESPAAEGEAPEDFTQVEAYMLKWRNRLQRAVPTDLLQIKTDWNNEKAERNSMLWHDEGTRKTFTDLVMSGIAALEQ